MLDPIQSVKGYPDDYLNHPANPFRQFLEMPNIQNPEDLLNFEEELHKCAGHVADKIFFQKLIESHNDEKFVDDAVANARANSPFPLIHKGLKDVSILLMGGTKVIIKTPYLRKDWKKTSGKKHKKRGKKGNGMYPVLEAMGIRDGVSPATRSEIALHTIQAGSYLEAIQMLERKGLKIGTSTLERIASATACSDIDLRDAALSAAMDLPISLDAPLAGKRVRASIDGGRTRTRTKKKGRKTNKGRHGFITEWKEPRILVIDLIDDDGTYDSLRFPLYDVLIDDADACFNLLIGYLRFLGAAHCEIFEFVSDGAEWIWNRVDQMLVQAEIPRSKAFLVLDFYHASEHLFEAVGLCKSMSKKKREKLYKELRHLLRHDPDGISKVIEHLKGLAVTRRGKKMKEAIKYFENHKDHMQYAQLDDINLSIGSGQVESAVRRVINLRFKSNGTFWKRETVEKLMHLRAQFKTGRWEELMCRVLTKEFKVPSFAPSQQKTSVLNNAFDEILSLKNSDDLDEKRLVG